MPQEGHSRGNTRVLSVVLHATHPGVALLDRFGVVDGGFRVLDVHHHRGMDERLRDAALQATGGRGSGLLWFGEQKLASLDDPARLLEPSWMRATRGTSPEQLFVPSAAAAGA